jgi:hypothetical protein
MCIKYGAKYLAITKNYTEKTIKKRSKKKREKKVEKSRKEVRNITKLQLYSKNS